MRMLLYVVLILVVAAAVFLLAKPDVKSDVVLYCGVDQEQSRPIAETFTEKTGITVAYQGEGESQRSIGLPSKLREEQKNPRADVFWSNEIMNMIDLSIRGLMADLPAGVADAYPPEWQDPKGRYVAFGARARILLVNKELLPDREDWPDSVEDLLDPKYAEMGLATSMAVPLNGTTYTHAVALLTQDEAEGKRFLEAIVAAAAEGRVKLAGGNGRVMQLAREATNKVAFCLTDTDDAWKAIQEGFPVEVVYPDQAESQPGTMLIPNTVAVVEGGPNPDGAAKLLAWLVGAENEVRLAEGPSAQIPLRRDLGDATLPAHIKRPSVDFRAMIVDWQQVGENRDRWLDYLIATFRSAD